MSARGPWALVVWLLAVPPPWAPALAAPAALSIDPPQDRTHPASMMAFPLPTHGVTINAVLYSAAGAAAHPTLLLLHGIPGNEQNLDLARAAQRAGWNVLTLHYRGSWGSPGHYSFEHCLQDAAAALDWLRDPASPVAAQIDRSRIVIVGHSLGGFVAAYVAGHDPALAGAALISPTRYVGNPLDGMTRAQLTDVWEGILKNRAGMHTVGDATAQQLAAETLRHQSDWDLRRVAPALARHPLLVVSSDDVNGPSNERLAAEVERQPGARVTRAHFATDHSYDDQRLALTAAVLAWLSGLDGGDSGAGRAP